MNGCYTAKPTGGSARYGSIPDAWSNKLLTIADVSESKPDPVVGFCLNSRCKGGKLSYLVEGKRYKCIIVERNTSAYSCKRCGYALFWTRRYSPL
jgi:hypothetical protein